MTSMPSIPAELHGAARKPRRRRFAAFLKHLGRSWRYATNRLTPEDAQYIFANCHDLAGWHPLDILAVEDALEAAHDVFVPHPLLPALISEACAQVSRGWKDTINVQTAREQTIALARAYAEQDGLFLTERHPAATPLPLHVLYAPTRRTLPSPATTSASDMGSRPPDAPLQLEDRRSTDAALAAFDYAAAHAEGWSIQQCSATPEGGAAVQIRKLSPPHDASHIFEDDLDVWQHLVEQARQGSQIHRQALELADPQERRAIESYCGPW